MLSSTEKTSLRKKLDAYEGTIPHMYLDSKGFVTVGIGHLLSTVAATQKLAFVNAKTNKAATAAQIKTDYDTVKKQTKNLLASSYKKHTKLKLSQANINTLTNKHIDSFHKELKKIYSDFDNYTSDVRLALFDLIFNLGMTKLKNNWPLLTNILKQKNGKKLLIIQTENPLSLLPEISMLKIY